MQRARHLVALRPHPSPPPISRCQGAEASRYGSGLADSSAGRGDERTRASHTSLVFVLVCVCARARTLHRKSVRWIKRKFLRRDTRPRDLSRCKNAAMKGESRAGEIRRAIFLARIRGNLTISRKVKRHGRRMRIAKRKSNVARRTAILSSRRFYPECAASRRFFRSTRRTLLYARLAVARKNATSSQKFSYKNSRTF